MRERSVTLPELALIAGTRGILGFGVGLLVAGYLSDRQRRGLAIPMILAGALSTIPIALHVLRKPAAAAPTTTSGSESQWREREAALA